MMDMGEFKVIDDTENGVVILVLQNSEGEARLTMNPRMAQTMGGWLSASGKRVEEAGLTPEQRAQWAMEDDEELWK